MSAGSKVGSKVRSDKTFAANLSQLKAYNEAHGHFNVDHKLDKPLYNFVMSTIASRKATSPKLTDERIQALDELGFDWNRQRPVVTEETRNKMSAGNKVRSDKAFAANLSQLKAYNEAHGHFNVDHKLDKPLYTWVKLVIASRNAMSTGGEQHIKMTDERIRALG